MPNVFYVYVLFDWLGTPRYIGKGKGRRWLSHEKEVNSNNQLKNNFIKRTWEILGEVPKIKLAENLEERAAFAVESAFIRAIGRIDLGTGPLTNKRDEGPDGHQLSEQTREIISNKTRARMNAFSPEERSELARLRDAIIKKGHQARTPEERSIAAISRWAKKNPEERSVILRKANSSRTPEQRTIFAKAGAEALTFEQRSFAGSLSNSTISAEAKSTRARKGWATRRKLALTLVK